MKQRLIRRPLLLALLAGLPVVGAAFMQSSSFRQALTWLGGGGSAASSAGFVNVISVGQPIAGVVASGGGVQLRGGFIQPSGVLAPSSGGSCTVIANPAADATCSVAGPSGPITITVPAGTFSQAATITLLVPAGFSPAGSSVGGLAGLGLGVEVSVSPSLAPQKPVSLTISYQDADVPAAREDRLRMGYYDDARGRWVPLSGTVDAAGNTVTVQSLFLGTFQLLQLSPAADLERGLAFPNPFRPGRGHARMTFSNLPEGVEVRLFTLTGEAVRTLVTDGAGQAHWDGANGQGEKVRSGVYLALFQRDSDNRVIKVAVER